MNKPTKSILATVLVCTLSIGVFQSSNSINNPVGIKESRSPQWSKVREEHLKKYPECAACGQKDNLNVHHIIPFHIKPELELEPENLITLCTDGPFHTNCHGLIGHCGNYKNYNPNVVEDAKKLKEILTRKISE